MRVLLLHGHHLLHCPDERLAEGRPLGPVELRVERRRLEHALAHLVVERLAPLLELLPKKAGNQKGGRAPLPNEVKQGGVAGKGTKNRIFLPPQTKIYFYIYIWISGSVRIKEATSDVVSYRFRIHPEEI